ncbi:MAG: YwaF family protein [Solobacterium sp.]|nr:YwaF family protein [Solobacterium sp.]
MNKMKNYLKLRTDSNDKGYGQFSGTHLLLVGIWTVFMAAYCILYVRCGMKARNDMRTAVAAALLVSEVVKMGIIYFTHQGASEYLPCEICSFAAYSIVVDAFIPGNDFLRELMVVMFLPAAIMALIFPTTTRLPVLNFFTFHQYFYHALIIAYILGCFFARETSMTYPGLWKSIFAILCLVCVMYTADRIFNRNFMFLVYHENNAMLKKISDTCGGGFRYTLGLVCVAVIAVHIFYGVFKLLEILIY